MFCIFWLTTIGSSLFLDKGMFVAALILWGGFGSLFTLAQRVDTGRSVSTFASRLEIALGASLATSLPDVEIPTAPNLPPQFVRPPLFSSRLQAGIFLAGLTAFWGGFLILGLMQGTMDGRSAHHGPTGPAEIAVFVLILVGGLLATIAQRGLLVRLTQTTIPTAGTMMRMIMPGTLNDAARKLGLNGPVVAGILYLVLVLGIVTFLSSLTVR
jgi:hypothetical protein